MQRRERSRKPQRSSARLRKGVVAVLMVLAAALMVAAAACGDGEDRPGVEVIDDGGSVSGSVSGTGTGSVSGTGTGTGTGTTATGAGSEHYTPVSDVESHANLALDVRDAAALMAPAKEGQPVDWAAVTAVYEQGGNSVKGDGSVRTLASLATSESVLAQFPDGASVFGTASFLDANVRAGLEGTGRGEGLSDNARRQLVEKGFSAIIYGKALQELESARAKIQDGNTDDAGGAPHSVDEAWAFYAGAQDADGDRPYVLSSTARKREGNFGLEGMVDTPLQRALAAAQAAARAGDLAAFDEAAAQVRGHLNTIFYLASLRYVSQAAGDTENGARQTHLAEGWAFFQTIRPAVASGSGDAAASIQSLYGMDASEPVSAADVTELYDTLNDSAVLQALAIPDAVVVLTPP